MPFTFSLSILLFPKSNNYTGWQLIIQFMKKHKVCPVYKIIKSNKNGKKKSNMNKKANSII